MNDHESAKLSKRTGKTDCKAAWVRGDGAGRTGALAFTSQLLRALQQLRAGISVPVFFYHGILLQSEHHGSGGVPEAGGGAEAADPGAAGEASCFLCGGGL